MAARRWRDLGRLLATPLAGLAAFAGARAGARRAATAAGGSASPAPGGTAGGAGHAGEAPGERAVERPEREREHEHEQPPAPRRRTAAEWTTLGVSAAIIAALAGVAVYEHVARTESAGVRVSVRLELERAERREEAYYVPFVVANAGREPAEAVTVLFEVRRGEEVVEESTTEIAFLANSGSAEGELVTTRDPAAHEIVARVGTLLRP